MNRIIWAIMATSFLTVSCGPSETSAPVADTQPQPKPPRLSNQYDLEADKAIAEALQASANVDQAIAVYTQYYNEGQRAAARAGPLAVRNRDAGLLERDKSILYHTKAGYAMVNVHRYRQELIAANAKATEAVDRAQLANDKAATIK